MRRNTVQRSLILQAARKLTHPTADDIYNQIHSEHPSISKGTIYRNLAVLVEDGKLRKVALPEGADRFDITLADHYHIQCRVCGFVADVDLQFQVTLPDAVSQSNTAGFLAEGHDIVFRGVCAQCQDSSLVEE